MDDGLRNLGPNEPSQLSPLSRSKEWVGSARSSRSAFHCLVDLNSVSRHVNFEDGLSARRLHLGVDIVVTADTHRGKGSPELCPYLYKDLATSLSLSIFWTVLWCVKASFLSLYFKLFRELIHYVE